MGRRSTIDRLPANLRSAVDIAVAAGTTIEAIVDAVSVHGGNVSKSAVGRYRKRNAELAQYQRQIESLAKSCSSDFYDTANPQMRMLLKLAAAAINEDIKPELEGSAGERREATDSKTITHMPWAVLNLTSARRLETEAELLLRKNERERNIVDPMATATPSGLTRTTINLIRRDILGLTSRDPLDADPD